MGWRTDHNYEVTRDKEWRVFLAAQPPLTWLRIRIAEMAFPALIAAVVIGAIASAIIRVGG